MAKAKSPRYQYKQYPQHQQLRVGIKVSWYYYEKEEDARKASEAADHNGDLQWQQGYDFGYQVPGSVRPPRTGLTGEWEKYNGLWEVCIP